MKAKKQQQSHWCVANKATRAGKIVKYALGDRETYREFCTINEAKRFMRTGK